MGLASMFLGDQNPFSQWVGGHQNFLNTIGSGLMQGQNLQHGLQIAGQVMPQARQLDLQQAEKMKADALKTAQSNYTLKLFQDKGFTDLVDLANAGAPMGELMQEYFKRIQPQAAPDPWDGTKIVDNNVLKMGSDGTPSVLWAPPPKNENWTDLTDAQEVAQGLDPKFAWQRGPNNELKQAGGGGVNVTTTVNPGENEYGKILGGGLGKQRLDILNTAATAPSRLATLSLMEQALNQDNFYSGVGADQVRMLQGFAKNMGLNDASGISSMETFNAAAKQLTRDKLGSLGAGVSNADVQFLTEIFPNLGATKEGNMVMIEVQKRIAKRELEIDRLATAYAARHGGMIDEGFVAEMARYNSENPVFADIFVPTSALSAKQAEGTYKPGDIVQDPNDPSKNWKFIGGDWRDRSNWTLLPQGGN